jgi:RimJ/RimL family protein N-acetyltransferase
MGVDLKKLPPKEDLTKALKRQISLPLDQKMSYGLIWEMNEKAIGHSNVNPVEYGSSGKMHLHLWQFGNRQKGIGFMLVKKSLPYFFENLKLKVLYCEPYALNPAPNKTLEKIGFEFVKKYATVPGSINFEQEVCQWRLTRQQYLDLFG